MISLENVSFRYAQGESDKGLHNINLNISDGQVILLCGVSGCGKTTITRLINGLIPHYYEGELSGRVVIDDKEIHNLPLYETSKAVGSVFQNPRSQFFNVDTTSELAFGAENKGISSEEISRLMSDAIRNFGIENLMDRSIFQLSGGEKQKIACASASVYNPSVLVLDEPSSNLDARATKELRRVIAVWKSQGKTIVIAEHRLYYLQGLVDRIIYMEDGAIQKELSAGELEKMSNQQLASMGLRPLRLEDLQCPLHTKEITEATIRLKDFEYSYKSKGSVLKIQEVTLPKYGIIAIIGHNGAGKSTLANCLCGLEKKCKGIMYDNGQILNRKRRLEKSYMVMQDVNHQLFTESVLDEVLLSMKEPDEKAAEKILALLDLLPFKELHPMSLSGGQKQRVAIASAIARSSDYVLFDEPTSGLDLKHMREVSHTIKALQEQGKTLFIITHDYELVMECCTYVLHLQAGELRDAYALDDAGIEKIKHFFLNS